MGGDGPALAARDGKSSEPDLIPEITDDETLTLIGT